MSIDKIITIQLVCSLFLLSPFSTAKAQTSINVDEDRIDKIFSKWDRSGSPGCAVGVYHDGTMIFSKGYGEAVLKEQTPITPQTIFYAGSISKQFTAAAIALLSIRGDIELDRPVRDYIPANQENTEYPTITVRQLGNHPRRLPAV